MLFRSSVSCEDPATYGSLVGQFLALQDPEFDHPNNSRLFFNHSAVVPLEGLSLLSTWGSPIRGDLQQKREAKLLIPYGSFLHEYQMDGRGF